MITESQQRELERAWQRLERRQRAEYQAAVTDIANELGLSNGEVALTFSILSVRSVTADAERL